MASDMYKGHYFPGADIGAGPFRGQSPQKFLE